MPPSAAAGRARRDVLVACLLNQAHCAFIAGRIPIITALISIITALISIIICAFVAASLPHAALRACVRACVILWVRAHTFFPPGERMCSACACARVCVCVCVCVCV